MKATFSEKIAKKMFEEHDNFLENGVILHQSECKLFYHKLDAKYFHVKQFFWKKQYFLRKFAKETVLEAILHF